ncbi:unnamed protein product [Symbiodinium sp. CCMP2592]|nr:unnamed protein product [Symbiodinium sp. CCMP2592]
MDPHGDDYLPPTGEMDPYARSKALLTGLLTGCAFSALSFQRRQGRNLAGLGVQSLAAGLLGVGLSLGYTNWQAVQVRHHAQALARLQENSEAVRMLPIGNLAPMLPAKEFDEATGQNAKAASEALLEQIRKEERAKRTK